MLNLKKGKLLISEPLITDKFFFKGIILITHYSKIETLGLMINHPTKYYLNDIIDGIKKNNFKIYLGGPVAQNTIQFIHTLGGIIKNSIEINNGLFWGGDFSIVKSLINNNKISSNDIKFFMGYSGWSENQLENEIKEKSWILENSSTKLCMQNLNSEIWSKIVKKKGEKYAIWANLPINPNLN
tara:strand:+ start:10373 stop:10924 length:552 start_codon:yes stop_codon:yes gene_type:complete